MIGLRRLSQLSPLSQLSRLVKASLPSLIMLFVFLLLWQAWVASGAIASYLLPSPGDVFAAFVDSRPELLRALASTLTSSLFGLGVSLLMGTLLAFLLASSNFLRQAFLPFAVFFQTVPIIAIAPLLVIWFGFGEPTVRASAAIVSFFPILANTMKGLTQVEPQLAELFRFFVATRRQTLFRLRLPSAFPFLIAGMEVSAGLAVIGALVGEFVGGGGLGSIIDSARTQQRVDLVFAAVILSSVLGFVFVRLVQLIGRGLLRLRPFSPANDG